jgi:hypothetical protein
MISPCWPQDLYRLGDYDSDGEIWDDDGNDNENGEGGSSDDSWETGKLVNFNRPLLSTVKLKLLKHYTHFRQRCGRR